MTLQPGQTLAHYRLVDKLGEGGMGIVWRAEDTKLGRQVAIKVLPASVSADADRLARFDREARVLAALDHPSIAGVYAFEHAESLHFLVMQLAEGEDLNERIARGPVPLDEALPIAVDVASALEAAHERGIVHRDLKPPNVKIAPDGHAKVLDFGLAKALGAGDPDGSAGDLSLTPTVTTPVTRSGVIMGTPSYMSPEQVKGRPADRRSDIWAFGCILFEMLAGRRLFRGDTISEALASVLRDDADLAALPQATPPSIRRLIARCLDRNPRTRLQSMGEARIALEALAAGKEQEEGLAEAAGSEAPRRGRSIAVALVLILAGFGTGAITFWRLGAGEPKGRPRLRTFTEITPARGIADPRARDTPARQAISPDGRWIAYEAGGTLYLRDLGEPSAREIPDSAGARGVFWSPASDAVAYAVGDRLMKFSVHGAEPVQLCRLSGGDFTGGTWSREKGIVFSLARGNWNGEVLHVPEEGGDPDTFATADPQKGERRLFQPRFLPDGRSILYTVVTPSSNDGEIAVERDGKRALIGLGNGTSEPAWSPSGHLVYTRASGPETELWALPFSRDTLTATGEPFRIVENGAGASFADDGTVLYEVRRPDMQQLVAVDRTGRLLASIGEPSASSIWTPAISQDGRRVAASIDWHSISVWDVARGVQTRITGESEITIFPEWMPGDEEIAYMRMGGSGDALAARRADGSGDSRVLLSMKGIAAPDFSADGKWMAFYVVDPNTQRDLWAVRTDAPDKPVLLLRTPANEALPRISPDGSLMAYQSDASGRWEVYVQRFPDGDGRWQVSASGGQTPRWNPRGGELFFVSGDSLAVAKVTTKPEVRVDAPRILFSEQSVGTRLSLPRHMESFYDVGPDGERFVIAKGMGEGTSELVLTEGLLSHGETGTR